MRALLKPFDGFRCHLANTLVGSNDTQLNIDSLYNQKQLRRFIYNHRSEIVHAWIVNEGCILMNPYSLGESACLPDRHARRGKCTALYRVHAVDV